MLPIVPPTLLFTSENSLTRCKLCLADLLIMDRQNPRLIDDLRKAGGAQTISILGRLECQRREALLVLLVLNLPYHGKIPWPSILHGIAAIIVPQDGASANCQV